jgi:chromosome segregation protein
MYLKSITLKGFKSFPDRTRLEFGPGVSVIVGPNGSGKSNITDAVLWALGEQSPLAVRGQSMHDMVFAGGQGVKGRSQAEVEIVIDNAAGRLQSEFAEIAISRHVDRSGEGTYRLNGARCRLVDLLEVLSDSGLGKEMHSVISQGKVEAIVHSKPEDRTAMIEEAAGLTKHRKRRHRAQLKLARTQDNLDRALDVEREARSRLRPLKRQAEAAELHARLERQSLETRSGLMGDDLLELRSELAAAEQSSASARARRDELERELMEVAQAREETERSFAEHGREREELAGRLFTARSAADRLEIRLDSTHEALDRTRGRLERSERALTGAGPQEEQEPAGDRLAELEAELGRLDRERAARLENELADVEAERAGAERSAAELAERIASFTTRLEEAGREAGRAADLGRALTHQTQEQARDQAKLELELEAIAERLRLAGETARQEGWRLADRVEVDAGYETALAAALGGRLGARVVESVTEAAAAVERAEDGGTRAIVSGGPAPQTSSGGGPPVPGADRLLERVRPAPELRALVDRLLDRAWVVERIADLPDGFTGIAVTRAGVAYDGAAREAWRVPEGGAERAIAERARREELHAALERAAAERRRIQEEIDRASLAERAAEERRDVLEGELRELGRRQSEAIETERRCSWLIDQRREHGVGPEDARRAELSGEITAERRLVERLERDRAERAARRERLEALAVRDRALIPVAERLVAAIEAARSAVIVRREALEQELSADEAVGERVAARLRELATREYELQAQMREAAEALTHEEVRVAQVRDRESGLAAELTDLARRLGLPVEVPAERLGEEERTELAARFERLERRRERLGPVNPLAEREYEEAVAHVEELEGQRKDLEAALAELQGLIRETDRLIRESFEETFEAAAKNFGEVIERLFPGGRGVLRRVSAPHVPRPVLGGEEEPETSGAAAFGQRPAGEPAEGDEGAAEIEETVPLDHNTPGIEIEVTPAGKTTRRLSLLSGGEKSLVALAFMFAVFLARPCPFYILDEVEAALDDANIDRFLSLVRAYADRTQFIVVTHQRRTMEAADVLYGVSMGKDGVSKVVSRRLESLDEPEKQVQAA